MLYEHRWLAVTAIGLSLFLSALDATIVALALPSGDLIGRFNTLPTFLISVLGFGLGSIICGLAFSFPLRILGRVM